VRLWKDQSVVVTGNVAISRLGGSIDDAPVRINTVWVHRMAGGRTFLVLL
jgi:hypothetical protein